MHHSYDACHLDTCSLKVTDLGTVRECRQECAIVMPLLFLACFLPVSCLFLRATPRRPLPPRPSLACSATTNACRTTLFRSVPYCAPSSPRYFNHLLVRSKLNFRLLFEHLRVAQIFITFFPFRPQHIGAHPQQHQCFLSVPARNLLPCPICIPLFPSFPPAAHRAAAGGDPDRGHGRTRHCLPHVPLRHGLHPVRCHGARQGRAAGPGDEPLIIFHFICVMIH